jgi:prepilin-type N-terminal cleavage/methylation domain-containing protein
LALKRYLGTDMGSETSSRRTGKTASHGFSLIELMIAMSVLAVGLLGGIAFIAVATANNGRSKLNTTAATLAESTMERIVAIPQKATGADALTTLADCSGHNFTINTLPGGSSLIASGALAGAVDYSQPAMAQYSMPYAVCPSTSGVTYDIRWRIDAGPTPSTQLVTVSVRSLSGPAAPAAQLVRPFTLHQLRGDY